MNFNCSVCDLDVSLKANKITVGDSVCFEFDGGQPAPSGEATRGFSGCQHGGTSKQLCPVLAERILELSMEETLKSSRSLVAESS